MLDITQTTSNTLIKVEVATPHDATWAGVTFRRSLYVLCTNSVSVLAQYFNPNHGKLLKDFPAKSSFYTNQHILQHNPLPTPRHLFLFRNFRRRLEAFIQCLRQQHPDWFFGIAASSSANTAVFEMLQPHQELRKLLLRPQRNRKRLFQIYHPGLRKACQE